MKQIIILLLLINLVQASESSLATNTPVPTKKKIKNYGVDIFFEVPSNEFLLSIDEGRESLNFPEKRVQYVPSATSNIGLQLHLLGLEAYYKTELFSKDSSRAKKYGKSQFNDLRLSYDFGVFGIATHYQNYKGFYADLNSLSGISVQSGAAKADEPTNKNIKEDIIIREDIESHNWGGELFKSWSVLHPYQNGALFQTDETFPIGLNFQVNLNYSRFNIEGSSPFIPSERRENFGEKATLSRVNYHRLGTDLGFDFKWFFSSKAHYDMGFKIGPGLSTTSGRYDSGTVRETNPSTHMGFNTGFNYEGETHQFKIGFELESWDTKLDIIQLDVFSYWLTLQYGIRF